jgi:hypothetical protein
MTRGAEMNRTTETLGTPERHRRLFEQKASTVSLQHVRARARELEQR